MRGEDQPAPLVDLLEQLFRQAGQVLSGRTGQGPHTPPGDPVPGPGYVGRQADDAVCEPKHVPQAPPAALGLRPGRQSLKRDSDPRERRGLHASGGEVRGTGLVRGVSPLEVQVGDDRPNDGEELEADVPEIKQASVRDCGDVLDAAEALPVEQVVEPHLARHGVQRRGEHMQRRAHARDRVTSEQDGQRTGRSSSHHEPAAGTGDAPPAVSRDK